MSEWSRWRKWRKWRGFGQRNGLWRSGWGFGWVGNQWLLVGRRLDGLGSGSGGNGGDCIGGRLGRGRGGTAWENELGSRFGGLRIFFRLCRVLLFRHEEFLE